MLRKGGRFIGRTITQGGRAFLDGLLRPTFLSMVIAIALSLAGIGGLAWVLSHDYHWRLPIGYLLTTPGDSNTYASWKVRKLAAERTQRRRLVLFTGGSAVLRSLYDIRLLSEQVSQENGYPIEVVNLSFSAQTTAAYMAILDTLGPQQGGLCMLGISPSRFDKWQRSLRDTHSGTVGFFSSATTSKFADKYGVTLGNSEANPFFYYADYAKRWASSRLTRLSKTINQCDSLDGDFGRSELNEMLGQHVDAKDDELAGATVDKPDSAALCEGVFNGIMSLRWLRIPHNINTLDVEKHVTEEYRKYSWKTMASEGVGLYHTYADFNEEMFKAVIWMARMNGFEVVLFEQPSSKEGMAAWDAVREDYRARVSRIMKATGVSYLNLNEQLKFDDRKDFSDLVHLNPTGRIKWQGKLEEELVKLFERDSMSYEHRYMGAVSLPSFEAWHSYAEKIAIEDKGATAHFLLDETVSYQIASPTITIDQAGTYATELNIHVCGVSPLAVGILDATKNQWIVTEEIKPTLMNCLLGKEVRTSFPVEAKGAISVVLSRVDKDSDPTWVYVNQSALSGD